MQVWNLLHAAHWKYRTQKFAICALSQTLSDYIFATKACMYQQSEKNSLNSNISSICPHNTVNFGPLTAEIGRRIWCTRANFNGFCVLASLLHRRRSAEVNQTLHDVWPSPGLVHYIYIFDGTCELMEFCEVQNSLCIQVLHSPILAALLHALQQCVSAGNVVGRINEVTLRRARLVLGWVTVFGG